MDGPEHSFLNTQSEDLVKAILTPRGDTRMALTDLLKAICHKLNVKGCIIWRATGDAAPPHRGHFTMLASSFVGIEKDFPQVRHLHFPSSMEGLIASKPPGHGWNCNDIASEGWENSEDPFFQAHQITKAMAMRFNFVRSGRTGVITVYRDAAAPGFDREQEELLQEVASVFPELYRLVRDRIGYKLMAQTADILRASQRDYLSADGDSAREMQVEDEMIQQIGDAVSEAFDGLETSVFTEDANVHGQYVARYVRGITEEVVDVRKQKPRATVKGYGFSGLAMYMREPVHIYDTQNPKSDEDRYRERILDFSGHSGVARERAADANRFLHYNPSLPPPHSLLVAPILDGRHVLGFLRCWVAQENPKYYSQDDEDLLRLVALELGHVLGQWELARLAKRHELITPGTSQKKTRSKEAYAFNLTGPKTLLDMVTLEIMRVMLELLPLAVPAAHINTIRWLDASKDEYVFLLYPHPDNKSLSKDEQERMRNTVDKRYPVNGASLIAKAHNSGNHDLHIYEGLNNEKRRPHGFADEFPGLCDLILAPLVVNDEIVGMLDVRSNRNDLTDEKYTRSIRLIAMLLSHLISLSLTDQATKETQLRAAELKATNQKIRDAIEDMDHQLKGPLADVRNRLRTMAARDPFDVGREELLTIFSQMERTQSVQVLSKWHFQSSSVNSPASGESSTDPAQIIELMKEVCRNNEMRSRPQRGITIHCDSGKVTCLNDSSGLSMDRDLLASILHNIVDNAVKYSYRRTEIEVAAGQTDAGEFFITVTNIGIPVSVQDCARMTERGWRGLEAQHVTGEGSGLGLYIVSNVMMRHRGCLEIFPTRESDNRTEVRLVFPAKTSPP